MEEADLVERDAPKLTREVIAAVAKAAPPAKRGQRMVAPLVFALSSTLAVTFGVAAVVQAIGSTIDDYKPTGGFAIMMLTCSVAVWIWTRRTLEQRAAMRRLCRAVPRVTFWLFAAVSGWGVLATLRAAGSAYAHSVDLVVLGSIVFGGATLALLSLHLSEKWRAQDARGVVEDAS